MKKCLAFWRLATTMEEEWDNQLDLNGIGDWWDLVQYINEYGELTQKQIAGLKLVMKSFPPPSRDNLLDGRLRYHPELLNIGVQKTVDDVKTHPWQITRAVGTYLLLEQIDEADPKLLEQLQRFLITAILNGLARLREDPDDNEWFYRYRDGIRDLYEKSSKFPKNLLEGLIKRFGVDEYSELTKGKKWQTLIEKPALSQWDVSIILNKAGIFTPEMMQKIIRKADDEAQQYMRSFIYHNENENQEVIDEFFILDENMRPMNIEMKNIDWPSQIFVMRFSWLPEEVQKVWGPVIADFGMVMR